MGTQKNTEILLQIIGLIAITGVISYVGWYFFNSKKKHKSKKLSDEQKNLNKERTWFEQFIEQYKYKMLSYYVLSLARDNNLSHQTYKKLCQEYEIITILPRFYIYPAFSKQFGKVPTIVPILIKNWLGQNYIENEDDIKQIENIISKQCKEKAEQIIKILLP